jgi:hypothetical protein
MRIERPRKPGWFYKGDQQLIALSEVPATLNITASEIADAVALGKLAVERVSGCKVVSMDELFRYIDTRSGKK